MRTDFLPGDRVVCIDNTHGAEGTLCQGSIYVIEFVEQPELNGIEWVKLRERISVKYLAHRFKIVSDFQKGDVVRCINSQNKIVLSTGTIFQVEQIASDGTLKLEGLNRETYNPNRFKTVTQGAKNQVTMNTFKPGDKVQCINSSSCTTFNEDTQFLKEGKIYTVSAVNAYYSNRIRLKEGGNNYDTSRFELVNQPTMNSKPFVFAQPIPDAQPENNQFYACIYIPIGERAYIASKYQIHGKPLLGETLHEGWGYKNETGTYRSRQIERVFTSTQEALDAGEKALRDVFVPTPPPTPASTETIRYVEL